MNDDWLTDALHRADARYARRCAEDEAPAGRFSAIYWLAFCAVALGGPVALWRYGVDVAGPIGAMWQSLAGLLAG